MKSVDEQSAYLTKGCVDVVRLADLRAKLQRSVQGGRPLTVKVGFDPTAPDLHLGHTVLIRKMKHFQDLGHRVIFLIGDFTGLIGDPTGRSKTRPPLTREEIDQNAETYKAQVFKILDRDKTVIDFNSRWLGALGSEGWVRLTARYNVARMLERRDFKQRYETGQPIAIHEFLYPLAQAYDSVFLEADVELGGTDQLFNLNVGRDIMPSFGLEPQVVMTVPLLVGLDGVEKMSKSLGNYVGVTDLPDQMFGKLMSISDELMWVYYELLTDLSLPDVAAMRKQVEAGTLHPKGAKLDLAELITADFHGATTAARSRRDFESQQSVVVAVGSTEIVLTVPAASVIVPLPPVAMPEQGDTLNLSRLLVENELASSASEATRTIRQGGVEINGHKVTDHRWRPPDAGEYIIRVGPRKFAKFQVTKDQGPAA